MATKKRRRYTQEEREAVLVDVPALGVCEAARKHGVPQTCVSSWLKAARRRWEGTAPAGKQAQAGPPATAAAAAASQGDGTEEQAAAAEKPAERRRTAAKRRAAARRRRGSPSAAERVAKSYTPSQKALALEEAAENGVTAASEKYDISRFSIYDWQRRVRKAAAGQGPSPTSGPAPKDIEARRDAEILEEWKQHPGLCPSQIVYQLRRRHIRVSTHTARRYGVSLRLAPEIS
jgi:transposase